MERVDVWLTEEIQKLLDNWPGYEGEKGFDAFKKTIKDKLLVLSERPAFQAADSKTRAGSQIEVAESPAFGGAFLVFR